MATTKINLWSKEWFKIKEGYYAKILTVKQLAKRFNKSESRIRQILKESY